MTTPTQDSQKSPDPAPVSADVCVEHGHYHQHQNTPSEETHHRETIANDNRETGSDHRPGESSSVNSTLPTDTLQSPKRLSAREIMGHIKWFIQDQWFLIVFGLLILISSQVQVPDSRQEIKRVVTSYLCVSIIFLVNGCTMPTKVLLENYRKWRVHLFVQLQCYIVTSAATFAIVSICATNPNFMDPWLLIGLLFVGCAPTTMSSNSVMTRQAHGNTALTVVQSVIGQFLCPFLTPIILRMYLSSGAWYSKVLVNGDAYGELYRRIFKQLGLSLFLPMFVGQVIRNLFPTACDTVFFKWKLVKLSSLSLLVVIWQTFDQAFASGAFASIKASNIIFMIFISFALYFVWLGLCFATATTWLPKRDVIACCYCTPAKPISIIVPLSSVMYLNISVLDQSKLQMPIVLYQGIHVAIGGILTIVFRKWIRPDEEREDREKNAEPTQAA